MSPAGSSAEEAKMKLLGWFEGYITKPLKRRTLASTLNRALSNAEELEPLGDGDVAGGSEFIGMNRTVLVAEDHEVNQRLFQTILQNLGFQVRLASNGKEAIAAMDSTVQLVFMDVQMPEMNGYEATEGIRSAGFKVPIIAVTASAVKGEREAALEIGMSDFLTKPFKKRDLEPILNTWLARTELDDATPAQDSKESEASGGGAAATVEEIPAAEIFDFDSAVDTFLGDAETVLSLVATLIGRAETVSTPSISKSSGPRPMRLKGALSTSARNDSATRRRSWRRRPASGIRDHADRSRTQSRSNSNVSLTIRRSTPFRNLPG